MATLGKNSRSLTRTTQSERTPKQRPGVTRKGKSSASGIGGATFPGQVVQPRHGRRRLRIQGSLQNGPIEGAPPPRRDFFLSRIKRDTDVESLQTFIQEKGIKVYDIQIVSHANAKFNSYRVSVDVNDKDKMLVPEIWPQGVCIEKWRNKDTNNSR